jgi:hypothetical protein
MVTLRSLFLRSRLSKRHTGICESPVEFLDGRSFAADVRPGIAFDVGESGLLDLVPGDDTAMVFFPNGHQKEVAKASRDSDERLEEHLAVAAL